MRNLLALDQEVFLLRSGKSTLPEDELAGLPAAFDLARALEEWRPDGVVVSNPTALHMEVAIPAAEAGCHLLLEKPIADTVDRVGDLRQALKTGGGSALTGYQFRFHPGLRFAKDLIEGGAIGRPLSAHAHWGEYLPGWHPWEDYRQSYSARKDLGGGVVLTLSHPLDYLGWFFGEAEDVLATTSTQSDLDLDVEDAAEILLRFQSGLIASVHLDYYRRPPRHDLEIAGTQGTITWDNEDGAVRWWTAQEEGWHEHLPPADFERNAMFLEEGRHFVAVMKGEASPSCTLEDGVRALEIALAAQASAKSGTHVRLERGS